jgi:AcrR family transcriptional regulator
VYQIFASKEELITALGIECRSKLLETVRRAVGFPGRSRERMVALGEAMIFYSSYHADDQRILKLIDSETILERVPERQKEKMNSYDVQVFQMLVGVIQDAIAEGDLDLQGSSMEGLALAFWAMIDGSFAANMGGAPLKEAGFDNSTVEIIRQAHYMMDGHGWRPLSRECDYGAVSQRVRAALLADAERTSAAAVGF